MGPKNPPTDDDQFIDQLLSAEAHLIAAQGAGCVRERADDADCTADKKLRRARAMLERLIASGQASATAGEANDSEALGSYFLPMPEGADSSGPRTIGRFQIVRELGHGGAGVVLLAEDPVLKRFVALKLPRPEFLITSAMRARFRREGAAIARLTHPHIVTLYEVGEIGPLVFLCAAYVPGPSLADWLQSGHIANFQDAAQTIAAMADAIDFAHANGVLHRDLKPANVLLEEPRDHRDERPLQLSDYTPKLVDFGLAKILDEAGDESRPGLVLGTPAYMAPEQARGGAHGNGVVADVYGLGAILYQLLTGHPPFSGVTYTEVLQRVVTNDPAAMSSAGRRIPIDLEAICLKCLDKDPSRRYPTAAALAADLRRWLRGEPVAAKPLGIVGKTTRWASRKPAWAALVAVSAAALVAISVIVGFYTIELRRALQTAEFHGAEAKRQQLLAIERLTESETRALELRHRQYQADLKTAYREWQDGRVTVAEEIVNRHLPQSDEPDLRTFEWYYLRQLVADQGQVLAGHSGDVYHAEYSADGKRVVSSGKDRTIRLWDAASGKLVSSFAGHTNEINCVTLSPDGQTIISGSDDGTLRRWQVSGGDAQVIEQAAGAIRAAIFTPDGNYLVSADIDGGLTVFECQKWQIVSRGSVENGWVHSLEVSPNGERLVVGGVGHLCVFSLPDVDHGPVAELKLPLAFTATSVSLDGRLLAYCHGQRVQVVALDGNLERPLFEARGDFESVCWTHDGKLVVPGNDGVIRLFDLHSDEPVALLRGHSGRIWSAHFSPRANRFVTAGGDGTVRIWSASHLQGFQLLDRELHPSVPQLMFRYQPDQLIWSSHSGLKSYGVERGISDLLLPFSHQHPWSVGASLREGHLVSWSWKTDDFTNHSGAISSVIGRYDGGTFTPKSAFPILSSSGRFVFLPRSVQSAALLRQPSGQVVLETAFAPEARGAAFSGDEKWLAVWHCNALTLFATDSGEQVAQTSGALACRFVDSRRELAVMRPDRVEILPQADPSRARLQIPVGSPICLAVSPDGETLAVGTRPGTIHLYSLRNGAETLVLSAHSEDVTGIDFSSNSRMLASAAGVMHEQQHCLEVKLWSGQPKPPR